MRLTLPLEWKIDLAINRMFYSPKRWVIIFIRGDIYEREKKRKE